MEIVLPVSILNFFHHRHVILHRRNKFYRNWTITDRVMTLCRFFKLAAVWRSYRRKSTFAFWFYDVSHLGRQRAIRTKFRPDILIDGLDITTSGCWKQTSAIFKFYSRFRFWPLHCRPYVILHRHTKFYMNWKISDRLLTSYRFYNMAAKASQIYFRFLVWPRLTFK